MNTDQSVWIIFQDNTLILIEENSFLNDANVFLLKSLFIREYELLKLNNKIIYCAELPCDCLLASEFKRLPFRQALDLFDSDCYGLAVKAYAIINWDKNHRYCGRCGSETFSYPNKFERECQICKLCFYPRISPSIIVLIHKQNEILMARSPHFLPGSYGLIAGFVEAGENVEAAVHREVKEEVGIKIKNLRYMASQAWPFPDSLMLGFRAEYDSGELHIDQLEIEAAGWYRYDQLPGRPSSKYSIASRLLDDFIMECVEANY